MDIEKLLKQCDFSKASTPHKERLKQELAEKMKPMSETELLTVAAAGENEPGSNGICKHGIERTLCDECKYL